nr:hypothetical protein Iba_chr02eCG6130 [Ipomoea batatas]
MPSENNCIIEDVDNEVNFLNPYDFNDSDSFDSSSSDDENCVDTCENNSFVSLDDNDVLESFTFDDESLSNELTNDLHEICGDDNVNIEASLCDLNDIECVTFHDNCLDDALYIHDLIATDESYHSIPSVKFTVFGQEHHLSVDQLGTYLGFYTQDHMNEEDYRNLPNDFNSDAAVEAYWHRISGGNEGRFINEKPNTSNILIPALKALKLLLNLTFGGRHKNLHKVYRNDLFRLWSLEMNQPIQMACMVHDWASMRALQIQMRTHAMDTFNRRMDFQDEALARHNEALERQNEAFARQEARQNQQLDAIEQIRLWRSRDSHPPRRVGTVLTELLGLYLGYGPA